MISRFLCYIPLWKVFLTLFVKWDFFVTQLLEQFISLNNINFTFVEYHFELHLLCASVNNRSFLNIGFGAPFIPYSSNWIWILIDVSLETSFSSFLSVENPALWNKSIIFQVGILAKEVTVECTLKSYCVMTFWWEND